jgi:predicted deacylase
VAEETRPTETGVESLDAIDVPSPGTKRRGVLRFSLPLLKDWSWPYTIIRGVNDGPRLALIAGVHPTEYPAIEAAIRTARHLDPAAITGTVVCLPLIDVPAFLPRSPFVCPIDGKNPNRFFPGDPNGTFTEAMADAIFRAVIQPSDYLIDLHGGDMVEALVPFTIWCVSDNPAVDRAAEGMANVFGLPYVVANRPQPGLAGMTIQAAAQAGIPAITPEAGSCGLLTESETQMLFDGVHNVLRHLGMLTGAPRHVEPPVAIREFTWLRSPVEGWWRPSAKVGDAVAAGTEVGALFDLFGDPLAEIRAPHDGDVLFLTTSPAMKEDGILLAIGGR